MSRSIKTLRSRAQVILAIKIHRDMLGTKDFLNELPIKMSGKLIGKDLSKRKWKERRNSSVPWMLKEINRHRKEACNNCRGSVPLSGFP